METRKSEIIEVTMELYIGELLIAAIDLGAVRPSYAERLKRIIVDNNGYKVITIYKKGRV